MATLSSIPTFAYQDRFLLITVARTEMRIGWRPRPLAQEKSGRGDWRAFWPEFRLVRPASDTAAAADPDLPALHASEALCLQKQEAFEALRRDLPPKPAEIVEPFRSHQWSLLRLVAESSAAMDLAVSNPVLAYCLANNDLFVETTPADNKLKESVAHSAWKQRDILGWLGFPRTEAMVRLMRKLRADAVSPLMLRMLRKVVTETPAAMEHLAHHPGISAPMLQLAAHPRLFRFVTSELLAEVARRDAAAADQVSESLLGALHLLQQMRIERRIPPFTRIAAVRAFCEQVDAEFRIRQVALLEPPAPPPAPQAAPRPRAARQPRRVFPPPPVPGTPAIVPLASKLELLREGSEQRNCVASYEESIRSGKMYIYRVLAPERATLSIVPGADRCWQRNELKKKHNHPVKPFTLACIDQWLAQYRVSV